MRILNPCSQLQCKLKINKIVLFKPNKNSNEPGSGALIYLLLFPKISARYLLYFINMKVERKYMLKLIDNLSRQRLPLIQKKQKTIISFETIQLWFLILLRPFTRRHEDKRHRVFTKHEFC